jgi:hypothetical protein
MFVPRVVRVYVCARLGRQIRTLCGIDGNVKKCVVHAYMPLEATPGVARKGVG